MSQNRDTFAHLAGTDIYLLDQVFKHRFAPGTRILDAGCGAGRNLLWFLANGFDIHAVDQSAQAITQMRRAAAELAPSLPNENFRVEAVEDLSFPETIFDAVFSIAVLHFARDDAHFNAMLTAMWRVLKPGGLLFCRLASSHGIENLVRPLGSGQFAVPDGSTRYLVTMQQLLDLTDELGAQLIEPIKTVNVQNVRCMTTWVCIKR
jgi:SAM-dependent methyltransferase